MPNKVVESLGGLSRQTIMKPVEAAMLAQSERMQLGRVVARINNMSDRELSDFLSSNPDLASEWMDDLSDQWEEAQSEAEALGHAVGRLGCVCFCPRDIAA